MYRRLLNCNKLFCVTDNDNNIIHLTIIRTVGKDIKGKVPAYLNFNYEKNRISDRMHPYELKKQKLKKYHEIVEKLNDIDNVHKDNI